MKSTQPRQPTALRMNDDNPLLIAFRHALLARGLSVQTRNAYLRDLRDFDAKKPLDQWQKADILAWLNASTQKSATRARKLSALRQFFLWQITEGTRADNPTDDIAILPPTSLPKSISESQVEALLGAPDDSLLGTRNRAMLELLYATGLRVSELVGLSLEQLNLQAGWVIAHGKGGKTRLVPIGENAIVALDHYLPLRKELDPTRACQAVFLSSEGGYMTRQNFWHIIKRYARSVGMFELSPHTLRHAFATHLVNHGANLRAVQMLLGHSNLSTTQIYTHIANARLKKLHQEHHPRG